MLFCYHLDLASLRLGGGRFVAWVGGVFGKKEAKTLWVESLVGTCDRRSHGKKGVKRDPFVCLLGLGLGLGLVLFVCLGLGWVGLGFVCLFVCLFGWLVCLVSLVSLVCLFWLFFLNLCVTKTILAKTNASGTDVTWVIHRCVYHC